MQSFYPKGAIKGIEKFEALVAQRHRKPTVIYLISARYLDHDSIGVYKCALCEHTWVGSDSPGSWNIMNNGDKGTLYLCANPQTGYIESKISHGYVFENLWHAYAYLLHLKQSNLRIDGEFPIAVS